MRRPLTHCKAMLPAFFTGLVFLWGASSGRAQKLPEAPQGPSVAAKISRLAPASQYVGNDRCRSCHRPEFLEFGQTPHAGIRVKGVAMTCETCHGPGKAHSDADEAAHGNDAKTVAANKLI